MLCVCWLSFGPNLYNFLCGMNNLLQNVYSSAPALSKEAWLGLIYPVASTLTTSFWISSSSTFAVMFSNTLLYGRLTPVKLMVPGNWTANQRQVTFGRSNFWPHSIFTLHPSVLIRSPIRPFWVTLMAGITEEPLEPVYHSTCQTK